MRILITGGAGFIGTNLCLTLLKLGHSVTAVDNFLTGSKTNLQVLKEFPGFTFIKHDIVKPLPKKLTVGNSQFAVIYHLACPTGVPNLIPLAEEILFTCSVGTLNVLDFAKSHKAKFLLASSSEVYGNPLISPQSENYTGNVAPEGVRSPYEEGKRFAESAISMYVRKYYLDAKIVRIFNTYGPFFSKEETRVIPKFLTLALHNKPLTVQGQGNQKRTFCYVADLIKGLQIVINRGKPGEVYNLGSDTQTTIKDLANTIIKVTHSNSIIVSTTRPSHDHESRLPDLTKVRRLGWKPITNLETGLKLTLASL